MLILGVAEEPWYVMYDSDMSFMWKLWPYVKGKKKLLSFLFQIEQAYSDIDEKKSTIDEMQQLMNKLEVSWSVTYYHINSGHGIKRSTHLPLPPIIILTYLPNTNGIWVL